MQSKETLNRLDNPPVTDGRKKPIDLGDMPEDMDLELTKVALYDIIESVLEKYKDGNLEAKSLRHNIASEVFKKIVSEGWYLNLNSTDGEPTTADEYNDIWLEEQNRTAKENYMLINDRINDLLDRIKHLERK